MSRGAWYADRPGNASCDRYAPDEHAAVLADEDSPAVVAGVFPVRRSLYATEDGPISARRSRGPAR
ncbi:MAG: hypothetical protein ACRDNT_12455 [Streptosporangiaceae bacterium]